MKTHTTVMVMALVTCALLWWKLSSRASAPAPVPEVPLPSGSTVIKRLESLVNLQCTHITIVRTTLRPMEVDRFYRARLAALGWREETREALPGTDRRPLLFRRETWECTTFAFPDLERQTTNLLLHLRSAGAGPRRRLLNRGALASRLSGFPLFPGVGGALLIEDGSCTGPATLLFETEAPLTRVVEFYRRHLSGGGRPFPATSEEGDWASGTFRFRQWHVAVNLCRRPAGGTSALVILNRVAEGAPGAEVEACSGGATF
ncbi:MAG: hypothetical protein QME79_02835 [Bacillota bacterium]|nr:hypothetical protein [Bacillota bacterium]